VFRRDRYAIPTNPKKTISHDTLDELSLTEAVISKLMSLHVIAYARARVKKKKFLQVEIFKLDAIVGKVQILALSAPPVPSHVVMSML
jgi:hypothetical protein